MVEEKDPSPTPQTCLMYSCTERSVRQVEVLLEITIATQPEHDWKKIFFKKNAVIKSQKMGTKLKLTMRGGVGGGGAPGALLDGPKRVARSVPSSSLSCQRDSEIRF